MTSFQRKIDEATVLDEPKAGSLMVDYAPRVDDVIFENPPRFSWLPVIDPAARYVLRISTRPDFKPSKTTVFQDIGANFFTPDTRLDPGHYFWSYAVWSPDQKCPVSEWSSTREFDLAEGLEGAPLANRNVRYADVDMNRPRLWLGPERLSQFSKALKNDPDHCGWSTFFEKSVSPWIDREVIAEPAPYPNNVRTSEIWRQTYIDCQEVLYAIRHLAIAGRVLDEAAYLDRSKEWLILTAAWDVRGTTSRAYNDEAAFRIVTALAWGYDWLHDHLNDDERALVRTSLMARTREIADHVIKNANIQIFPYDSHAVRALSASLVPACIALLGEDDDVQEWLDYTVEFLFTLYSPWGGADGGWAEGPHYWMTGMAYLIDAANLMRNFMGADLYQRPFFQKTGDFPLYTKSPFTRRGCFGDDSTMGDLPSLKVGYNLRQFAGVTGNGYYQWYFDEVKRNDPGTEGAFYNYGWWDLNFDELTYRSDFDVVDAKAPSDLPRLKWFKDVGWAAIQHCPDDITNHIQFLFKSSEYGSVSHSHGDQNAFLLSAFGEDLAIQSGHYVAFGSSMHRDWRRQTRSKNAILIDGVGQYAGRDKAAAKRANGVITQAEDRGDHVFMSGDATAAYAESNPDVTSCLRDIYFVHDSYFVIVDRVEAKTPISLQWLFHSERSMSLSGNTFRLTGQKAGLYGQFILSTSGQPKLEQTSGFEGIDPAELEGLQEHWQLTAQFEKASRHVVATLLVPYPKDKPRRIFNFIDDQGYTADLYFTDSEDRQFKVVLPKEFSAS